MREKVKRARKSTLTMPTKLVSHFSWLPFAIRVSLYVSVAVGGVANAAIAVNCEECRVPNVILAYVLRLNFAHPKLAQAVNVYVMLCISVQSTIQTGPCCCSCDVCVCLCVKDLSAPFHSHDSNDLIYSKCRKLHPRPKAIRL